MCTWNMNGLARWKIHHRDLINILETNDLVCVTETWLNITECELICQEFKKNFKVFLLLQTQRQKCEERFWWNNCIHF